MSCPLCINNVFLSGYCKNKQEFVIEIKVYNYIMYSSCCNEHLTRTIHALIRSSNCDENVINSHLCITSIADNTKKYLHFGNTAYGPETEEEYNNRESQIFNDILDKITILDPSNSIYKIYNEHINNVIDLTCYEVLPDNI